MEGARPFTDEENKRLFYNLPSQHYITTNYTDLLASDNEDEPFFLSRAQARKGIKRIHETDHRATFATKIPSSEYNEYTNDTDNYRARVKKKARKSRPKLVPSAQDNAEASRIFQLQQHNVQAYRRALKTASPKVLSALRDLTNFWDANFLATQRRQILQSRIRGDLEPIPRPSTIPQNMHEMFDARTRKEHNMPSREVERFSRAWVQQRHPEYSEMQDELPVSMEYTTHDGKKDYLVGYKCLFEKQKTTNKAPENVTTNLLPAYARKYLPKFRQRDSKSTLPEKASPVRRAFLELSNARFVEANWSFYILLTDAMEYATDLFNEIISPSFTDPNEAAQFSYEMTRRRQNILEDMDVIKGRLHKLATQVVDSYAPESTDEALMHYIQITKNRWPINSVGSLDEWLTKQQAGIKMKESYYDSKN